MQARRIALLVACATLAAPAFSMEHFHTKPTKVALHGEPPIVVTESRATDDSLITGEVVDTLASDSRLAGKIGVQTLDREVELTGIVTTAGQSRQAERDAMSVYGVRNVSNKLATRMGAGRY